MRTVSIVLALCLATDVSGFMGFGRGSARRSIRTNFKSPFKGKNGFGNGGAMDGGRGGKGKGPFDAEAADSEPSKDDEPSGVKKLWDDYNKVLTEKPLVTKAMTSLVGFTIGDLLAQFFIEKGSDYNLARTLRLASFGFLIHGTTGHWFYGKLDKLIPGKGAVQVFSKVGIDQVFWNPIFGVMFFGYMGALEGSGVAGTINKIKADLMTQVTGSWKVWPTAHAISFRFVPTEQRLLYINTIQIFYNMFLSVIGNRTPPPEKA